jgi:hypothetical protein
MIQTSGLIVSDTSSNGEKKGKVAFKKWPIRTLDVMPLAQIQNLPQL